MISGVKSELSDPLVTRVIMDDLHGDNGGRDVFQHKYEALYAYRVPCTVYRVPCTVYRVPCTVYRVPYNIEKM